VTEYCSAATSGEPLAGTAPTESHLLVIEAPGRWGASALADCSLPAADRSALAALPPRWRVILARRPDRPLRRQRDRFVWRSDPDGTARQWRLPLDAAVLPDHLPGPGRAVAAPTLLVCTNGGRDRCCAMQGRPLVDRLASPDVWECSHLGGHRFAPTALRLPDRLVFGRLTGAAALGALAGQAPLAAVRGPAGWPAPVQAAVVAVWRHHRMSPIRDAAVTGDQVRLTLQDGTAWQVAVRSSAIPPRPLSCGAEPLPGRRWQPGVPVPLGPTGIGSS
jgi:hypothetical protein